MKFSFRFALVLVGLEISVFPAQCQTLTVSPTLTLAAQGLDYDRNYIEATGGNGIDVSLDPNNTVVSLSVESSGGTLLDADVLVRSASAGSTLTEYGALAAPQMVWEGGGNGVRKIRVDVRVKNIRSYGFGTPHSKSLLFTIAPGVG